MTIETIIGVAFGVALSPFLIWNKLRNEKRNERVRRVLSTFAAECINKGYTVEFYRGGTALNVKKYGSEVVRVSHNYMDIEAYLSTLDLPKVM